MKSSLTERGGGREEHVKSGNLRKLDYLAKRMAALSKPPSGWRKSNFSSEVQLQPSSNLATSLGFFFLPVGVFIPTATHYVNNELCR